MKLIKRHLFLINIGLIIENLPRSQQGNNQTKKGSVGKKEETTQERMGS